MMRIYEFISINLADQQKQAQIQQQQVLHQAQLQQQRRAEKKREAEYKRKFANLPSKPIPDPVKHERRIRKLTAKLGKQSNVFKPTERDLRVAQDRVDTMQRKADLDFKNRQAKQLRRHSVYQSPNPQ